MCVKLLLSREVYYYYFTDPDPALGSRWLQRARQLVPTQRRARVVPALRRRLAVLRTRRRAEPAAGVRESGSAQFRRSVEIDLRAADLQISPQMRHLPESPRISHTLPRPAPDLPRSTPDLPRSPQVRHAFTSLLYFNPVTLLRSAESSPAYSLAQPRP